MAAPCQPVSMQLSAPPDANLGVNQHLAPLIPPNADLNDWRRLRADLRRRWDQVLGAPSLGAYDQTPEAIDRFDRPEWSGVLYRQPTGPTQRQLVLLMEPKRVHLSPRPGAVVPYYHPDLMSGFDLMKREPIRDRPTVQFGRHLVQQGYVVVCTEAFPFNTVPEPVDNVGFAWWHAAADKLLRDNPRWTGMGKLVHDTRRAVDLLLAQPDMDENRILAIGHSLGGKMAFYAGCLDSRIRAIIASDFGIGWDFTNWRDPWYLGSKIERADFALAHHQLLALHAPDPFLLIAGQYDKRESWQYLEAARAVYRLYGQPCALGMFDHHSGHQPTEESMRIAYRWLAEQFGLSAQPWSF